MFPDSIIRIGRYAFQRCHSLKRVTLPPKLRTVCGGVFSSCANLRSVIILEGVTCIERAAFYDCDRLTEVSFPSTVGFIGSWSFWCANLRDLVIPEDAKCELEITSPSGWTRVTWR